MDKDYNLITVNQDVFTIDDAREAAKQLFEIQVDDFYALKNEKWYKHLLNAVTFGTDRKKKVIKDIRTLSKLQTIFMRIYCENYKSLDSQLNEIIDNIAKTNESVRKIYVNYIVGVKSQQSILDLSQLEQDILLLLLCSYISNNGNDENLKKFRAGVAQTIGRGIPQGEFKPEMLEQIKSGEIFYRFITEMCAIDGGLDDFSIPDNIYDAINYLTISNKAKQNIESQIKTELYSFGVDYLVAKYGVVEENLFDDDIELKDEDSIDEEFATLIIDKELKISKGKQQVYKNKEILFHANVSCDGELVFENCTIKYNDSALSSKIKINSDGRLSIVGCSFVCLSYKDDYLFECRGNVTITKTQFIDCSYLFLASKDVYVEECRMTNCSKELFNLQPEEKSKVSICKNIISQNELRQFYKEEKYRCYGPMIAISSWRTYGCVLQFNNNIITEGLEFTEIYKDDYRKFKYITCEEMSITQCTFIGTSGSVEALSIEECYFKECKNPIKLPFSSDKNAKIENCIFEKCESAIRGKTNTEIKNCQFVSCKNSIINCDDAFDGGVLVDSCVFKDIQNDFEGKDSDYMRAYDASALRFKRSKRVSSKENRIINCTFDGADMKKAFLIAPEGVERPWEDTVVSLYKCNFIHCTTKRNSKKLVREYFSYYGLFNKEKSVHATKISSCTGLDKINSEGSNAENLSINFTSTFGRKIGADITLS